MPVSERLQTLWPGFGDTRRTIQDIWNAAYQQLEAQLDSTSFNAGLRGAVLVDFEPEQVTFVVVTRTSFARDVLLGRLERTVKRILRDICGQQVEVRYWLLEEWVGRGTSDEQIA